MKEILKEGRWKNINNGEICFLFKNDNNVFEAQYIKKEENYIIKEEEEIKKFIEQHEFICSKEETFLDNIIKANKLYVEKSNELNKLYKRLSEINSLIDLKEVEECLNYDEVKALFDLIKYKTSNKKVIENLKEVIRKKKIEKYPEILKVHYYKEINEIDFLEEKEKIDLDNLIKEFSTIPRKGKEVLKLDKKILEFLCSKGILKKYYVFYCNCNSMECDRVLIDEKRRNAFYKYHNFDYDNATDEEIEKHEESQFEYIEVSCWNDKEVLIENIEEFEKNLRGVVYEVEKEPDMTLDNL